MYNDKDDNDYCEGFLYEDVNWKLVEEYVGEESINLVLKYPYWKFFDFFSGQTEMISILWNMSSKITECPMTSKVLPTLLLPLLCPSPPSYHVRQPPH